MFFGGWSRLKRAGAIAAVPIVSLCGSAALGADGPLAACSRTPGGIEPAVLPFSLTNTALTPAVAFADIGCALIFRQQLCAMDMVAFDGNSVVRDAASAAEIPAEKAFYAVSAGDETPFGYGVLAFAERAAAEKHVQETGRGKVVSYDELKTMKFLAPPAPAAPQP